MQQFSSSGSQMIVLAKGEQLHEQLATYATTESLKGAWIQGIGGSSLVTLGCYDPIAKDYQWKTYIEPLEILSLQGNLAWVNGKPFWHMHGTFSGRNYHVVGGHVKELLVGLTLEATVTPLETQLTRVFDDDTGLKLLEV